MSPAAAAMKTAWFLGLVVVWFCAVASIAAQENIRLHFELYKNGKQVGAPAVTVKQKFPSRRPEPTEKQSASRL
jgi:hypothetical protein